jgi:Tfp pilus assembly protein PilF
VGKKQDDLAIADLTHAIQIKPKDWAAYQERAGAYQNRHQYDLAFADLTRPWKAFPSIRLRRTRSPG